MIMPKPRVTADVDKGSMNRGSKKEAQADVNRWSQNRINKAAQVPVTRAIKREIRAKMREYWMA
jgi:hypothetical protein